MRSSGVDTDTTIDLRETISADLEPTIRGTMPSRLSSRASIATGSVPLDATQIEHDTPLDETAELSPNETETLVNQDLRSIPQKSSQGPKLSSTFGPSIFSEVSTLLSTDTVISSDHRSDHIDTDVTYDVTKGPHVGTDHLAQSSDTHPQPSEASRFEIREVLGAGSFGEVLSAQDQDLNRQVAIKHYRGDLEMALRACRDELRFLGRLEHPNIPTVYQASVSSTGNPYIVMQQLVGESLQEIINRLKAGDSQTHARYSFRYRINLMVQLLRILEHTHQARVLHRDIKPDNIYIGEHGALYLIDWGIAEDFNIARDEPVLCGTPMYFSPEQGQGHPLTPASDIYGVGAVAYELLCLASCAPPSDSLSGLISELPTFKPSPVDRTFHSSQGYAPSEFKFTIMKAIKRNPLDRFQSAGEMADDLERALDGRFRVLCPRTFLKYHLIRFSKWIDQRLQNVMLIYAILIGILLALIGFGVLIGYWIA